MKKEKKLTESFCMKYNEKQFLEEGCKHLQDFCPYRQSCLIAFYSKEKLKENKKN